MILKVGDLEFKIRNCNDEDYVFAYNLSKRNMSKLFARHWGGWNPSIFRKGFDLNDIRVVEYKEKRVAYYDLKFEEDFAFLNNIQVSGLMKNKGLGSALMAEIEKEVKRRGFNRIKLEVLEDNRAKSFYFRLGYKQIRKKDSSLFLEKMI